LEELRSGPIEMLVNSLYFEIPASDLSFFDWKKIYKIYLSGNILGISKKLISYTLKFE